MFIYPFQSHSQLLCTDDTQHNSLSYKDNLNNLWDLTQFEFTKTSYLASYLSCTKFLEQISKKNKNKIYDNSFKILYPKENKTLRFKYTRLENNKTLDRCNDIPGCQLTFFQNIFNPIYLLNSKRKLDPFEDIKFCKHNFKKTDVSLSQDDTQLNNIVLLPAESWELPAESLDENLFKFINQFKPEKIYLSTMIPSLGILKKLDDWLLKNPGSQATVLFAYNLAVLDPDFPEKFNFKSDRLSLLPVFQTPETTSSYHVKGGLFIKKDVIRSLFYSVNLRRFREEKVADIAFLSSDKSLSLSLFKKIKDVIHFQCENIQWLQCSQRLRYFESDERKKQIDQMFQTTCQLEKKYPLAMPLEHQNKITSGSDELTTQLVKMIDQAKTEILISTHVYGDSLFHDAILKANGRGVKIKFLLGSEIEKIDFLNHLTNRFDVNVVDRKTGFTSHAKFIIIDDLQVVWGTGNFTKTSLRNPFDIFIKTTDKHFKDILKNYFFKYYKN